MTDYDYNRLYAVSSWRGKDLWAFRARRGDRDRWVDMWCVRQDDDNDTRGLEDGEVDAVRPLVVVDVHAATAHLTEARDEQERIEVLLSSLRACGSESSRNLADQVAAQTRPSKPSEPRGLAAVVKDRAGYRYIRGNPVSRRYCWVLESLPSWAPYAKYEDIDAVEVLSEGVTP